MARVNISIPDDLKASMDGLSCNWSAVAQAAFAHAVEVERSKAEGKDIDAGLARLRASKRENQELEHARGFADGKEWALTQASYDELSEIAGMFEWVKLHPDRQHEPLEQLNNRWATSVSPAYALGYLEAAAGIFAQV